MIEKHQAASPSSPASNPVNMDEESTVIQSKKPRRNKIIRLVISVSFFIVFHSLILVALGTIIPVIKPKFRIRSVTIENLSLKNDKSLQSFNMKLIALVTLKNRNFGAYKFHDSNLTFSYKGTFVGEAAINRSSVKIFSTKKMRIILNLSSNSSSIDANLGMDIASGMLTMSGSSRLRGQVEYMKVLKRDKSAIMNCTMTINLVGKLVQGLRCD